MQLFKTGLLIVCITIILSCATSRPELKIVHQATGPIETNCYLIYDTKTMEAALVDAGDIIDTLVDYIKQHQLDLKYILCTHGHIDHLYYVPSILDNFPEAKTVIHKLDYDDLWTQGEWIQANMDA